MLLLLSGTALAPLAAQRVPGVSRGPVPTLLRGPRYDVVMLTHATRATLDDDALLSRFFQACRFAGSLRRDDSVAVARSRPWDWNDATTSDQATLTILVRIASANEVRCDATPDIDAVAAARGYQVVTSSDYPGDATISSARLLRGSRIVDAVGTERTATMHLSSRGLRAVEGGLYRLTVPLDAAAPDSTGSARDLILEVTALDSTRSARIVIPWAQVEPLWSQVLPARARRGADLEGATHTAFERLARATDPIERAEARAQLGVAFAGAGDTAAARVLLAGALREEPCLTLHASAGPAADLHRSLARPPVRCRASLTRALAVATLAPGFANLDGPVRKAYALTVLGVVAGTLAASRSRNDEAESFYARYLAVDGTDPVVTRSETARLYDRAEAARTAGTTLVAIGTTTWVLSIAEALWTERRLLRRLERVRDVRPATAGLGLAPHVGSGRVGLAFTFR